MDPLRVYIKLAKDKKTAVGLSEGKSSSMYNPIFCYTRKVVVIEPIPIIALAASLSAAGSFNIDEVQRAL